MIQKTRQVTAATLICSMVLTLSAKRLLIGLVATASVAYIFKMPSALWITLSVEITLTSKLVPKNKLLM